MRRDFARSGWIPRDADDTADLRATVRHLAALLDDQAAQFAAALSRQESVAQAARAYVAAQGRYLAAMVSSRWGDEPAARDATAAAYEALAAAVRGEQP